MGYNSTVVILNDVLSDLRNNPRFGEKLADAIAEQHMTGKPFDVQNGVIVVEQHHADETAVVAVGGNCGTKLGMVGGYTHHTPEDKLRIVKSLANDLGFNLSKQRKKKWRG